MLRTVRGISAITLAAGAFTLPLWFSSGSALAATDALVDNSRPADLIIHKQDSSASHAAISGVTFSAARLSDIDLATNAGWQALTARTAAQPGPLAVASEATTDSEGTAKFNDLPVGAYLVTETNAPAGVVPGDPFLVTLPVTDQMNHSSWVTYTDGGSLNYLVEVSPKNDVISLVKSVNDADGYTANDTIRWTVTAKVPFTPKLSSYRIHDQLDGRLAFIADSVRVLDSGFSADDFQGSFGDGALNVKFTQTGLVKLAALADHEVQLSFDTHMVEGKAGVVPNVAQMLVNSDSENWEGAASSNEVRTIWANIALTKLAEDTSRPLAGAEFDLGYQDVAGNWKAIKHATTDADGTALFTTIRVEDFENSAPDQTPRQYFLTETKAPQGYQRFEDLVPVHVAASDQTPEGKTVNVATVVDKPQVTAQPTSSPRPPDPRDPWGLAGGPNLPLLTGGITVLVLSGGIAVFVLRRRRQQDAND